MNLMYKNNFKLNSWVLVDVDLLYFRLYNNNFINFKIFESCLFIFYIILDYAGEFCVILSNLFY